MYWLPRGGRAQQQDTAGTIMIPRPGLSTPGFGAQEQIDIHLLKQGIYFLCGEIGHESVTKAIQWITFANQNQDLDEHSGAWPLTLYINSAGGNLYDAFALIDVMRASSLPIQTIGIGSVLSAAFLIFTSGAAGRRFIGPNCGLMCHQFSDSVEGKHHDLQASLKEGIHCDLRMMEILKTATGLDAKIIKRKLLNETDQWFTSAEALDMGIADQLFTRF